MINARIAAMGGAAMLAFAGFAHAAAGPLRAPVEIQAAQPAGATAIKVVSGPAAGVHARGGEFVVVSDTAPSVRSKWPDAPGARESFYSNAAGTTSEAPLPGALWLFGSALLAFLGICARRRF